jgi:hypothetical protein
VIADTDWPELLFQHAKAEIQTARDLEAIHVAILAKRLGNSTLLSKWNHTLNKSPSDMAAALSTPTSLEEISRPFSNRRASMDAVLSPVFRPSAGGSDTAAVAFKR